MAVTSKPVRFGVFELDLNAGRLCKIGRELKLQEQPYRILSVLLERPGEIVTRDRLREALWPADTFVDFDHSLNAAIAKLRQALGDSADNPRFIETVAKRGYRFIAPVETTPEAAASVRPRIGNIRSLAMALAAVALVAVIGFWIWRRTEPREATLVKLTEDSGLTMSPAPSTDGKLLAYASDRGDGRNLNIWIQQLTPGGSAVQLTHEEADTGQPSFSPDGSRLVYRSGKDGGGIYSIPTIGGEATRLAPNGRDPRFSPDGKWIAYWVGVNRSSAVSGRQAGGVYVMPAEGGPSRHIGLDLLVATNPIWSPDGKRLLVSLSEQGDVPVDLWAVSLDGQPSRQTGIFGALERQGFSIGFDRIPRLSQWNAGRLLFSASYGDGLNVWRMPVSSEGRSAGPAERLTSGTTLETSPVISQEGNLIFASLNLKTSIWSLPVDADRGVATGEMKKIVEETARFPSISLDGRMLAFNRTRRGAVSGSPSERPHQIVSLGSFAMPPHLQVMLKDLWTGTETAISDANGANQHPEISRDGTLIAFTEGGKVYMSRVGDGPPKLILEERKRFKIWDWSPDNRRLLGFSFGEGISMIDVSSKRQFPFLGNSEYQPFQTKFSPDGRWVTFVACGNGKPGGECRLFVAPLKGDGSAESADKWMAVDHPSRWDDKPRWSPNGDSLYFVSDRDGDLCLWVQRLDSRTKRPDGAPAVLRHFHDARLAMSNIGTGSLEIDVARDKVVMGLGELAGNIWSLAQ